jgi:hypothetical protein
VLHVQCAAPPCSRLHALSSRLASALACGLRCAARRGGCATALLCWTARVDSEVPCGPSGSAMVECQCLSGNAPEWECA